VFTQGFFREFKNVTRDALNYGIAWIYPYYDEQGEFKFKRFDAYEVIPLWADKDHTVLEGAIRIYPVDVYDGKQDTVIYHVEVISPEGIDYYECDFTKLTPIAPYHTDHMTMNNVPYNWARVPLVPFKYTDEQPLIMHCKSLQDGINAILSNFEDNMEEDVHKSILILVNYDGQDLGEFKANLATYGAVKVRTTDGVAGDLKTLTVEVNSDNYRLILDLFRKALVQNCMGYDATEARTLGNPNQMNIQSVYNDIDMDASDMETEFQASLEHLLYFINVHLYNTGKGNYLNEKVIFTFNTDMPMDESSKIANIMASQGLLSKETLLARHPYVDDVAGELDRLEKQEKEALSMYDNSFPDRGLNNAEDRYTPAKTTE
jgi:SPP1 family phage portal protein